MSGAGQEAHTVGFVGLGAIGIEMTRSLPKAGHAVRAFDVTPAAVQAAQP